MSTYSAPFSLKRTACPPPTACLCCSVSSIIFARSPGQSPECPSYRELYGDGRFHDLDARRWPGAGSGSGDYRCWEVPSGNRAAANLRFSVIVSSGVHTFAAAGSLIYCWVSDKRVCKNISRSVRTPNCSERRRIMRRRLWRKHRNSGESRYGAHSCIGNIKSMRFPSRSTLTGTCSPG